MKNLIAIGLLNLAMASASWSLTPAEIFENVEAKYLSLDSIAFESTVVSETDYPDARTNGEKHASTTTCKASLARPSFYRIGGHLGSDPESRSRIVTTAKFQT
jgi:hypothetical protein